HWILSPTRLPVPPHALRMSPRLRDASASFAIYPEQPEVVGTNFSTAAYTLLMDCTRSLRDVSVRPDTARTRSRHACGVTDQFRHVPIVSKFQMLP
ncbi:MAG: hypothetical protein ACRDGA_00985, partial [Bacteroidota bacterium]